jgi:hypothetical protein
VREKDAGGQSWVSLLAGGAPTAKGSSWMPFQVNAILCRALNCKSHVTTACAAAARVGNTPRPSRQERAHGREKCFLVLTFLWKTGLVCPPKPICFES